MIKAHKHYVCGLLVEFSKFSAEKEELSKNSNLLDFKGVFKGLKI